MTIFGHFVLRPKLPRRSMAPLLARNTRSSGPGPAYRSMCRRSSSTSTARRRFAHQPMTSVDGLHAPATELGRSSTHIQHTLGEVDIASPQRDQLTPPQTRERRCQHEHPKPVRHSLREGVNLRHSRGHSLRRLVFPAPLMRHGLRLIRPSSTAVLKIARAAICMPWRPGLPTVPHATASPASFGRCLWSTQQAQSRPPLAAAPPTHKT